MTMTHKTTTILLAVAALLSMSAHGNTATRSPEYRAALAECMKPHFKYSTSARESTWDACRAEARARAPEGLAPLDEPAPLNEQEQATYEVSLDNCRTYMKDRDCEEFAMEAATRARNKGRKFPVARGGGGSSYRPHRVHTWQYHVGGRTYTSQCKFYENSTVCTSN